MDTRCHIHTLDPRLVRSSPHVLRLALLPCGSEDILERYILILAPSFCFWSPLLLSMIPSESSKEHIHPSVVALRGHVTRSGATSSGMNLSFAPNTPLAPELMLEMAKAKGAPRFWKINQPRLFFPQTSHNTRISFPSLTAGMAISFRSHMWGSIPGTQGAADNV